MDKSTTHIHDTSLNVIALKTIVRVLIATLNEKQSDVLSKCLTSICDDMEVGATDQAKEGLTAIREIIFDIVNNPLGSLTDND